MKTWIQSLERRKLEPRRLTVEMVGSIEEIAHSLAGEFRFTRQTRQRYSVAQHATLGSRLLPDPFAGAFLLHELSETYISDVAGPMKPFAFVEVTDKADAWAPHEIAFSFSGRLFLEWTTLERQHTRTMLESLRLSRLESLVYSPEVKAMDLAMLRAEKEQLCGEPPEPWGIEHIEPAPVVIQPWTCEQAQALFLHRFHELFGRSP
jgi:hypothetical protein